MNYNDLTDKELMNAFYEAVECQDGFTIKQIHSEMSRRNKDE